MYLKLKPRKSTPRLGICAKLSPRYCGRFEVLDKIGLVSYNISLLANIKNHNVFHVSLLKKYFHDTTHIIYWNVLHVELEGEFLAEQSHILDRRVVMLHNIDIAQLKIQWKHFSVEEETHMALTH